MTGDGPSKGGGVLGKKQLLFFVLWISVGFFSSSTFGVSVVCAQSPTHIVVKGETLQSICVRYYGDGDLWPKLWKINPLVTDPGLLHPDEVIFLFEDMPIKTVQTPVVEKTRSLIGADNTTWASTAVDVSEYCNVEALGFLSPEGVTPWGHVTSDETERIFLAQYDTVYVTFEKDRKVKPGDSFNLYRASDNLEHPLTGDDVGTAVLFLGKIILKSQVSECLFKAEIVESYRVMRVGDPLLPYTPVSACVQPSNPDWKRYGDINKCDIAIVASKDQLELMGQYSVVYINQGYKHGVKRGNLFAIVTRIETTIANEADLPELVLGYLIILESRLETATAVVLNAKKDFPNGTTIKAVDLAKTLKNTLADQGYQGIKEIDIQNELMPILMKIGQNIDLKKDLPESLYLLSTMVKCSTK